MTTIAIILSIINPVIQFTSKTIGEINADVPSTKLMFIIFFVYLIMLSRKGKNGMLEPEGESEDKQHDGGKPEKKGVAP